MAIENGTRLSELPEGDVTPARVYGIGDNRSLQFTPKQVADAGHPFASNAEAVAGEALNVVMNPATTRAAIDSRVSSQFAPLIQDAQNAAEEAREAAAEATAAAAGVTALYTFPDLVTAELVAPTLPLDILVASVNQGGREVRYIRSAGGPDLGGGWVQADQFITPANAAVFRPVVQRQRDSVSALDLMTAGGLDNAVRNREATTADAGVITAALQEALTACAAKQWRLDVPAGTFHLNAKLVANQPVAIKGSGETGTILSWDNGVPSAGISISAGGVNRYSQVSDMTMFCDDIGASQMHTAIKMDYSSLIGTPGGDILPRANKLGGIHNVTARSVNGFVGRGWGRGVEAVSMLALDVSDCRFNGVIVGPAGNLPVSDNGIWFYGEGRPVQLTIDRCYLSAFNDAVLTGDTEGVYITNNEFVNVRRGYKSTSTRPESGVVIMGTHMNVLERAIDIENLQDVVISNCLFYTIEQSTVSDAFIVLRAGSEKIDIFGNIFRRFDVPVPMDGIRILGGTDINIGHNTWFMRGQTSTERTIRISAGVARLQVARQSYPHSSGALAQIENASTDAQFEEFRGFAGDLNTICTARRMIEQSHVLTTGATNFPPSWADPVGGIVTTYAQNDNDAVQNARNARFSGGATFFRRKLGGTWSAWA